MARERSSERAHPRAAGAAGEHQAAPGRRTLTEQLVAQHSAAAGAERAATAAATTALPPAAGSSGPRPTLQMLFGGPRTEPAAPAPQSSGAPLPATLRGDMEHAFGADFADVRVHHGSHVSGIGALAYAQGNDLHFAPGAYDPASQSGRELIGHELTHVVQQRSGAVSAPQGKGAAVNADPALEAEADRLGAAAARGAQVHVSGQSGQGSHAGGNAPIQMMPFAKIIPKTWYNVQGFPQPLFLFTKESIEKQFLFLENPMDHSNGLHIIEDENQVISYHENALPKLKEQFKILSQLPKSEFDSAVKQLGAIGYADSIEKMGEYDRGMAFQDKSVYTAEMDNCITVGFIARTQTAQFNALLHSFQSGSDIVGDIFAQLSSIENQISVKFGKIENIQYYVVGGNSHPDSVAKATQILQHLLVQDLPVMGIALPTGADESDLIKGVLATQTGQVHYTTYVHEKKESKDSPEIDMDSPDFEEPGGFTSARNMPGFTSARNMPGSTSARNMPGFTSARNTSGFTTAKNLSDSSKQLK